MAPPWAATLLVPRQPWTPSLRGAWRRWSETGPPPQWPNLPPPPPPPPPPPLLHTRDPLGRPCLTLGPAWLCLTLGPAWLCVQRRSCRPSQVMRAGTCPSQLRVSPRQRGLVVQGRSHSLVPLRKAVHQGAVAVHQGAVAVHQVQDPVVVHHVAAPPVHVGQTLRLAPLRAVRSQAARPQRAVVHTPRRPCFRCARCPCLYPAKCDAAHWYLGSFVRRCGPTWRGEGGCGGR